MFIKQFIKGPLRTNSYLISCPLTKEAVLVDAPFGSFEQISPYIESESLQLRALILTHSHWDHIADVSSFKKRYALSIYIHTLDIPNLVDPGADGLTCPIHLPSVTPDKIVEDQDFFSLSGLSLQIIHTPGHSPGSICLYEAQHHVLFSGDTLFKGSIGNINFPTSQPDAMWNSLKKLSVLPLSTKIYPGHGPETTIRDESWLNRAKEHFGY